MSVPVPDGQPEASTPGSIPGQGAECQVLPQEAGWRLDHFLSARFPEHSRSFFLKLAQQARVSVNGRPAAKAGLRLKTGDRVAFAAPAAEPSALRPEPIAFEVLFEDEDLLLLSKPPGLTVHPGSGQKSGTLANGLLYRYATLPGLAEGRAGLVHRLDKDTSGLLLVARNERCLQALMAAFQERSVRKVYHAILLRSPVEAQGRITAPIGRHPLQRQKMAVREQNGRFAATNWRVVERFANGWVLAEIGLETGRTHQIRVHMSALHCPVAGDTLYGGRVAASAPVRPLRQMLHASSLTFTHPVTGQEMTATAPFWPDMQAVLAALRGLGRAP